MWTEEMEKILTSPAARRIVPRLSPVYGDAYVALCQFNAIGKEIDNMDIQTQELMLQTLPQTATWGIGYWEEDYSIPSNDNLSTEDRRRVVLTQIRTRAPMNPCWVKLVLDTLTGTTVQIVENISKNRFEVVFEDVLDNAVKARVRSKLEEIKPAHLIYLLTQIIRIAFQEQDSLVTAYQEHYQFQIVNDFNLHSWMMFYCVSETEKSCTRIFLPFRFSESDSSSMFPEVTFPSLNQEKVIEKASDIHFLFQNIQSTTGDLVYNRPWKFDGKFKFNGNHKFNSGVEEEVF